MKEKQKVGELKTLDLKIYYRITVTKTLVYCHKDM